MNFTFRGSTLTFRCYITICIYKLMHNIIQPRKSGTCFDQRRHNNYSGENGWISYTTSYARLKRVLPMSESDGTVLTCDDFNLLGEITTSVSDRF